MKLCYKRKKTDAFTLTELLTVMFILSLLIVILAPALRKAKRTAMSLLSSNNQKETITGVSCYAADHKGRFPESVATLGTGTRWSWREPMVLTGFQKRSPVIYRSVGQYLNAYIKTSSTLFCPCAPSKYEFSEQAWAAGDKWDNPNSDTGIEDPLFGNYCLYWNYVGYLEEKKRPFIGPRSLAQGRQESKLLMSDYFGYGHWRNELFYNSRDAYGSCEKIRKAGVTTGTSVACDFWSLFDGSCRIAVDSLSLSLNAGYVDGHVELFTPQDVEVMKVSMSPDGQVPYPDNIGPAGNIFIPRDN